MYHSSRKSWNKTSPGCFRSIKTSQQETWWRCPWTLTVSHMKKTRQRNHILFTHFQLMQFVSLLPIMKFNTCTWNLRLSTRQKGCSNWMMNQIVIFLKLMGCYQQNVFFRDSSYVAVQKTMKNNKQHMGVSKNRDTPKWMVKIMENPTKMGWFGGKTHHFRKTPIYSQLVGHWPTLSRP